MVVRQLSSHASGPLECFITYSFLRENKNAVKCKSCVCVPARSSNSGHLKPRIFCVHCPHTQAANAIIAKGTIMFNIGQAADQNIDLLLQTRRVRVEMDSCQPDTFSYLLLAGTRSCGRAMWNYATCWPTALRSSRLTSRSWHRERWVERKQTPFDNFSFVTLIF